jgi:hypothetical protein
MMPLRKAPFGHFPFWIGILGPHTGTLFERHDAMAIFLFWIIGAVLVGKYAHNKGLGGLSFVVISLCASPLVGVLLVLVAAPDREKAAKRAGMRKCPQCAEYVKQEAPICRFCGHRFSDAPHGIVVE